MKLCCDFIENKHHFRKEDINWSSLSEVDLVFDLEELEMQGRQHPIRDNRSHLCESKTGRAQGFSTEQSLIKTLIEETLALETKKICILG